MEDHKMLWICDIDGCLSEGKNHKINLEKMLDLRKNIIRNNLIFSLCTGRSQAYVELFCQVLDIKTPCICENGCYLYDPVNDSVIKNPNIPLNYIKFKTDFLGNISTQIDPDTLEVGKDYIISIKIKNYAEQLSIIKSLIDLDIFDITSSKSAIDIAPKNINKHSGLMFLKKYNNMLDKKCFSIGDSYADICFLEKSFFSACPSNAALEVKTVVDYISKYPDIDGVLDIINSTI